METGGVRTAKTMGLRNLPSKCWQVNCGRVIAANIAADLAAWTRLPGFDDDEDLRDADPSRKANRHHTRNRAPAQSATGPKER